MGANCNTCNRDISTVREVRGCGQCQSNGTAAGVHARFNDFDPVELMIEGWINPPFTLHAKIEADKAEKVAAEAKAEGDHSLAEEEAKEVTEEIEMAAEILVEDASATAKDLAENIHGSHASYAVEILESRISARAAEMKENRDALEARFNRDITDRARLVANAEQSQVEAVAAISAAHSSKEVPMIMERLGAAVREILDARQKASIEPETPAEFADAPAAGTDGTGSAEPT